MEYGCIAKKLGHSYSADIHAMIGGYDYVLKEVPEDMLADFMTKKDFKGINVTIPYKKDVMPFLDEIDPLAEKIGSVNTVVNDGGRLKGYNTDILGMTALLNFAGIEVSGRTVLVLGTGGTSVTAQLMAKNLGAKEVIAVSRSGRFGAITYADAAEKYPGAHVIINTTPVGMFPDNYAEPPIDIDKFSDLEAVADAVFNPFCTNLVLRAKSRGIKAVGGIYMLVAQAVYAAERFTGKTLDKSEIDRIYHELLNKKQNVALIGMPACGKTTVGRAVAKSLGRDFIDLDVEIELKARKRISDIFAESGEEYFRDIESEVLRDVCKRTGLVISTGGGAILRDKNVEALRQNCKVFFLDRDVNWLRPTKDRPTASDFEAIKKRYEERYPKYLSAADEIIKPVESVEINAKMIVERFLR